MLIKNMLEDVGDDSIQQDNPIPIPNVSHKPAFPSLALQPLTNAIGQRGRSPQSHRMVRAPPQRPRPAAGR